MIDTEGTDRGAFAGRTSGGEHLSAPVQGQVDRRHPDPPGGGVHQHPLARLESGEVVQPVHGREVGDRDRRRLLDGQAVG